MNNSFDIWVQPGSTFNLTLTATNQSGTPINLSGYSVNGVIKYSFGSTGYLLNLSPTVDPTVTGQINISVPSSQTSGLPITKGVYDIEAIQSGTNYSFKVIRGYANISTEVSAY